MPKKKVKSKSVRRAIVVRPKSLPSVKDYSVRVNVKDVVLKSLVGGLSAVALGAVTNRLPIPEQVKPFVPAVAALATLNSVKGKVANTILPVIVGAMVYSTIAAAKKFIPGIQLAGELGVKYDVKNNSILSGNNVPLAYIPELEGALTLTY